MYLNRFPLLSNFLRYPPAIRPSGTLTFAYRRPPPIVVIMDDMYPHHAARAIQPRHSVLCVAHLSQITIVQHPQERGAVGRTCRAPQLQNAAMRHISDTKNVFSDTIGAASSYELPRNSPHLQLRLKRPAAASWNVIPGVSQRPIEEQPCT